MKPIIVIGGGGHAKVLISVLKKIHEYRIIGFTDAVSKNDVLGVHQLGDDTILDAVISEYPSCSAAIGIGFIEINRSRNRIVEQLESKGFILPAIISPDAIVNEDIEIGPATVVFDGAVINSGARIGKAVIVNTHATIEHDCSIDGFVHIAPGVTLSGSVRVGHNTLIGTGANVIQGVTIVNDCLVGAGSTVIQDLAEPGLYYGNPAKLVKSYARKNFNHC